MFYFRTQMIKQALSTRFSWSQCSIVIFNYRCAFLRWVTAADSLHKWSTVIIIKYIGKVNHDKEPIFLLCTLHLYVYLLLWPSSSMRYFYSVLNQNALYGLNKLHHTLGIMSLNCPLCLGIFPNHLVIKIIMQILYLRTLLNIKVTKCFKMQQKKDS